MGEVTMRSKTEALLAMAVAVVLMVGVVVAVGCAAPEQPAEETATAEEQAAVEEVEYLFVQHAETAPTGSWAECPSRTSWDPGKRVKRVSPRSRPTPCSPSSRRTSCGI
jgi:hypothetical protein